MKLNVNLFFIVGLCLLLLTSFASVVYLYETKEKISSFLNFEIFKKGESQSSNTRDKRQFELEYSSVAPDGSSEATDGSSEATDEYWAKELMNGGYILHFRHAERDKWIDVTMYDVLESDVHSNGLNESRYAENDYFSEAVCLNDRGKIQAQAIGEILKHIRLPIGVVHSSVSCRSRQTADLAFGGVDKLHRALVHAGPYNENSEARLSILKELYASFTPLDGTNTVVSSHNKVIECGMFINEKCHDPIKLEEGGFYVLRNTENGLVFEHEFHNFVDFSKVFYRR